MTVYNHKGLAAGTATLCVQRLLCNDVPKGRSNAEQVPDLKSIALWCGAFVQLVQKHQALILLIAPLSCSISKYGWRQVQLLQLDHHSSHSLVTTGSVSLIAKHPSTESYAHAKGIC